MRKLSLVIIFLVIVALAGFSLFLSNSYRSDSSIIYENNPEENLSNSVILNVPYISQNEMFCSEASVAMVLHYYGKTQYTQEFVHENIAVNFENMFPEIRNYLENSNFAALRVKDLKKEIDENDPVIIRIIARKIRHTVVVVGYQDNNIYVHDPAVGENLSITSDKLCKYWIPVKNIKNR